jgi:hypothetical protein
LQYDFFHEKLKGTSKGLSQPVLSQEEASAWNRQRHNNRLPFKSTVKNHISPQKYELRGDDEQDKASCNGKSWLGQTESTSI